jgi:ATP-dependent DNA helicase RecG
MDISELKARITRGEDIHTDFKARFDSNRELAKDLVCFANTDGGHLIFGVSDEGRILGVDDPDPLFAKVDDVAFQHCEPPVTVIQELLETDGKKVVVVNIPKGEMRPYQTKSGICCIRTASGCRRASRQELLRLFQAVESLYYDETPLPRLGISDLNLDEFEKFLEETGQQDLGIEPEQLLRNWRLISGSHPTVAGIILFGRKPQQHLPYAQVNAARIPGTDISVPPSDMKDMTGRLLDVIDQVHRFLRLYLPTPHEIKGFLPEANPELPAEALREAVINALAHRDYTVHGPVRLFILDDRIEIHTPGTPPNTVDEPAMRSGVHVVRNPHIYARLSDAGLVTRAGSGIRRIIRLIKHATGKDIGIDLRNFEVLLTIPRKKH